MKQTPHLDAVALFLAVADASGLAGAARQTGVSVPTLSRRMGELEGQLGEKLFVRGPRGYALTARGRDFYSEVEELRRLSARVADFGKSRRRTRVRVTAGHWTSRLLATNLPRFWSENDVWVPELVDTVQRVDIARREADIGIRNKRPDQSWLAGRKTAEIHYAAFAVSPDVSGYVVRSDHVSEAPTERWVKRNHEAEIITTANSAALAMELALSAVGRIVLPVFAAKTFPQLQQVGPMISELSHDEWLVCHHEGRHDPPVRGALEAIAALLSDRQLRGE
ncbi:LysR family transcriptional regulator [Roseibium sp.]|uniref:LysR family transcriptional regulator n=1 Tax=Roseibium sp. TaxID=1936156 RepID=UPI003A9756A2